MSNTKEHQLGLEEVLNTPNGVMDEDILDKWEAEDRAALIAAMEEKEGL